MGIFLTGLPVLYGGQPYAVTKDGQRFLVNAGVHGAAPITVVINWTAAIH
jgi:hypothetical protein